MAHRRLSPSVRYTAAPHAVDPDGTGALGFAAFEAAMARKLGERDSAAEMRKAFQLFDDDGSGRVCMYAVCLLVRLWTSSGVGVWVCGGRYDGHTCTRVCPTNLYQQRSHGRSPSRSSGVSRGSWGRR